MLGFDGGGVVVANKQPPSKTSTRMLDFNGGGVVNWWRYGRGVDGGGKQAEEGTAPPRYQKVACGGKKRMIRVNN